MKRLWTYPFSLTAARGRLAALFILVATPPLAVTSALTGRPALAATEPSFSILAAPAVSTPSTNDFPQGILFPYSILDRALRGSVDKTGDVDYLALKGDKNLELFLQAVATADLSQFPSFEVPPDPKDREGKVTINRAAEMVFWINAYNAHLLKTLSDAYPLKSPDEIKELDTAKTHRVAGQEYSLREMREKVIGFDPRALFALTEGMRGGPATMMQCYRFYGVNDMLNAAVSAFINDPRNVEVVRIQNKVTVNDFLQQANALFAPRAVNSRAKLSGVRFLLSSYTDQRGERSYLTTNDYQIVFKPRDRSLNQKESSSAISGP
jgi:Protein of unknown function, DUF547